MSFTSWRCVAPAAREFISATVRGLASRVRRFFLSCRYSWPHVREAVHLTVVRLAVLRPACPNEPAAPALAECQLAAHNPTTTL
jgi:hypothetical protein